MLKTLKFLEFNWRALSQQERLAIECQLQFTVQRPSDSDINERAILVKINCKGDNDLFQVNILCRVIYTLSNDELTLSDEEFLSLYQKDSYTRVTAQANDVIVKLGKKPMEFPDGNMIFEKDCN